MVTPLGITFSTDEQVMSQGDVTFMGRTIELLVVEFDQAKYKEFLSFSSKSQGAAVSQGLLRDPFSSLFRDFSEADLHKEHHCWPYHT